MISRLAAPISPAVSVAVYGEGQAVQSVVFAELTASVAAVFAP